MNLHLVRVFPLMMLPLFFTEGVSSQVPDQRIDSLHTVLLEAVSDSQRIFLMYELGYELAYLEPDSAVACFDTLLRMVDEREKKSALSDYYRLQRSRALSMKGDIVTISESTNAPRALQFLLRAVAIQEGLPPGEDLMDTYFSLSKAYTLAREPDKAQHYLYKAMAMNKALGNPPRGYLQGSLAQLYTTQGKHDSARAILLNMLEWPGQLLDVDSRIRVISQLSLIYVGEGRYAEARELLEEGALLSEEFGAPRDRAMISLRLGNVFYEMGRPKEAIAPAEEGLHIARSTQDGMVELTALKLLVRAYEATGSYRKALEASSAFIELNDSIYNDQQQRTLRKLEAEHELASEILEDSLRYANQLQLTEVELTTSRKRRNIYLWLILSISVTFLMSILYYLKSSRDKQRQLEIREMRHSISRQQLAQEKLERENLELRLLFKERDIDQLLMKGEVHQNFGQQVLDRLEQILNDPEMDVRKELRQLTRDLSYQINVHQKVETVDDRVQNANTEFESKLFSKHPDLTKGERELCVYIRSDMSNKDIAAYKNTTPGSIAVMKFRVRKKLGFDNSEALYRYLMGL